MTLKKDMPSISQDRMQAMRKNVDKEEVWTKPMSEKASTRLSFLSDCPSTIGELSISVIENNP